MKDLKKFDIENIVKPILKNKRVLSYMPNETAFDVAKKIKKGVSIIGLTRGQFSLIDLIYAILKTIGASDVICTTWSAGIKDANTVKWMCESDLIKSFLLITDHSYVTRQSKYALEITQLFGEQNIRTSEIHAKFCLISNDDFKITIRTSMNLNANRTCENFEIDDSEEVYEFYKNFVVQIFGEMPKGFIPNSNVVNRALDVVFNNLKNQFDWLSNE